VLVVVDLRRGDLVAGQPPVSRRNRERTSCWSAACARRNWAAWSMTRRTVLLRARSAIGDRVARHVAGLDHRFMVTFPHPSDGRH